jgi:hypothetical protein
LTERLAQWRGHYLEQPAMTVEAVTPILLLYSMNKAPSRLPFSSSSE